MGIAICKSHPAFGPNLPADIMQGGDRFTERIDQEALLDILVRTERDHGRPTAAVQKQMKEAWGWADAE